MIKIFDKRKVVNVKPPMTDEERAIVSDLIVMGYTANRVDEIKVANRISRPKIKKADIEAYLDAPMQNEFFNNAKIQAVNEKGENKYRKDGKPQTIGFMGALRKLEKEHNDVYEQLLKDIENGKKAAEKEKKKK